MTAYCDNDLKHVNLDVLTEHIGRCSLPYMHKENDTFYVVIDAHISREIRFPLRRVTIGCAPNGTDADAMVHAARNFTIATQKILGVN